MRFLPGKWRMLSRAERLLVVLFVFTLPLVNPWVRGDGVGYYAYARSVLIDGDLDFENEWLAGNENFVARRVDQQGRLTPESYTATGRIANNFTIGPALLWAPALVLTHLGVRAANALGAAVPADGYSKPYLVAMAVATALYGFLGLWLAFRLARRYFEERWALLAVLGIWLGSALPVYMYFNPSWSHAHSAFAVALFLWYWQRTRGARTPGQWLLLGALGGLMVNIYYPNGVVLLVPLLESLRGYAVALRARRADWAAAGRLLAANALFAATLFVVFLPTLITRAMIFGHPLRTGYPSAGEWNWTSPALGEVLFSANHGLFSWTPILLPAVAGLALMCRWRARRDGDVKPRLQDGHGELGAYFVAVCAAFYYVIASYPTWHGISSFGNRFFISLTPLFVVGLAGALEACAARLARPRAALAAAGAVVALLIAWNLGFIFQWGTRMVPARGPVSWREVARNQVVAVPQRLFGALEAYILERGALMDSLESHDQPPAGDHRSPPQGRE